MHKQQDRIQSRLVSYAQGLDYEALPADVIHAAKVRIIDTLGALIGGFFAEPCRQAREIAALAPDARGATVIGTRMKTSLEMAAFANGTAARYLELADFYHWPGSAHGHPSDVIAPLLATAEYAQAGGREFITSVVLGYEVYQRLSDAFHNSDFDTTNFTCIGIAVAAGKLLALSDAQLAHCISMATVSNVVLRQVRKDTLSMFKATVSGQAGRASVFAALLARAGMEGPHLPFEGKAGWCDHVARERFSLDTLGGRGTPFKILDSRIKLRPAIGTAIPCILAAEKVAPLNIKAIKRVTVEVYERAKDMLANSKHCWNPDTRESADHSAPYLVAAALMDGKLTLRSFDDAHLSNTDLRALMQKIDIVVNDEFTQAYERSPQRYRTRVTVTMDDGEKIVGEVGGDKDDVGGEKSDAQIADKFRGLTEDVLGSVRANAVLERLWRLEHEENIAGIPAAFALG